MKLKEIVNQSDAIRVYELNKSLYSLELLGALKFKGKGKILLSSDTPLLERNVLKILPNVNRTDIVVY